MEMLLDATLRLAAPLLLAALGELLVERAGVVNIGIEGMMLCGAFAAFAASVVSGSPAVGVGAGVLAGCVLGGVFVVFAVVRRADQIVVGTAINLLALGATGLALRAMFSDAIPSAPAVGEWRVPGLSELPLLGPALFRQTPFTYAALVLAGACAYFLARTRAGLRLRAVGEAARAADAEGVRVECVRGLAVLTGAGFAGLAGAVLPLAQSNTFAEGMTAGRGFIALAIVIFGRWKPSGVILAALFFGAATALQFRLQARGLDVPYPLALMLPYVLTLVVLAFASGRARAPGDLGRAYRRESK